MTRIIHNPPPEIIRQAELADAELNPDGLLGRIGWGEVIVGLVAALLIGFALGLGSL